jgi:glycerol kinase
VNDYILSIDAGTTGVRVLLFDKAASVVRQAYSEFDQHTPRPGWVEHDADQIWNVTRKLMGQVCSGLETSSIAAAGITNQRETTVVWDRSTGRPIHRAIVWQCRRTEELCNQLKRRGAEPIVRRKTGLVVDAYFSGTKIQWLLDNVPGARERANAGELAFGTIDSWLIYNLTGGRQHVTDLTNASRTMLLNIDTRQWDDDLLELMRVPRSLLPEVLPSAGDFGVTERGLLGERIPICGVVGDQQGALFGQGGAFAGAIKNTYGTGCFLLINTGSQRVDSQAGLITTLACGPDGGPVYALEGSVFIAGAVVQWLRDQLGVLTTSRESEALATGVPDSGGVYFVPAFQGLGAPYWDMAAKGAILGLTRATRREHIVRAALESIAYQSRDLIDAAASDLGRPIEALRVDGGATDNGFLMQFQADILGAEVQVAANRETTAQGAAYLAGLGSGFWSGWDEIARSARAAKVYSPDMPEGLRRELYAGWRAAVARVRS